MSRITQVIEALEAERAEMQERLEWLEKQIEEFRDHHQENGSSGARPGRVRRRATARGASTRRAAGRARRGDTKEQIIGFLKQRPGSTAGDVASGLNLKRNSVATRLTQLTKSGDIKKATKGYSAS